MLKKTITYTDYNGVERTEDHYFNLTHAELVKMESSREGGLQQELDRISRAKDAPSIMHAFDEILRMSYGKKSPDGRRLMKGDDIFREFQESEAYSLLYMELLNDEKTAAAFIRGILPKDLQPADNVSSIPAPSK